MQSPTRLLLQLRPQNPFAKISIKVSVSTLSRDSQRPEDVPLPMSGPPSLLLEEAEVNMANVVFAMQ